MPSLVPLDNTLGALYVGVIFSSIVYGVICTQAFLYYTEHCKRDGWFLKGFVAFLWFLETVTCVLFNFGMYYYTVTNFGDYDALLHSATVWSILVEIGLSTFIALLVQCFFAHRVYILGGKTLVLPIIIVILSLAQFSLGMVYTDVSLSFKRLSGGTSDFPYVISLFGLELVADCTIAASSIYYLRSRASHSGISTTRRVINLIIKFVVNTCLLEVFCLIPILALWTAEADTLIFSPFVCSLPRIYSASVMCSLNNRDHLRGLSGSRTNGAITLSTFQTESTDMRTQTSGGSTETTGQALDISKRHVRLPRDRVNQMPSEDAGSQHDVDFKGGFMTV
ncbi:unnamed protein product [Peniophora sp. CBMAI 1063]|nr:unnamed protein product [Peniophora sp. CBMAI 1063]